jgi:dihydrofolate reductase
MRKIIVFNRVTADGYYAAADGNLDWAVPEPGIEQGAVASMDGTGAMLFGRKTYDLFESFWPTVGGDSAEAPDPHAAGRQSRELSAMASWINAASKLVFSRTRKEVSWNNSHLLGDFAPEKLQAIKKEPGKDIMVFGSGSIVSQLNRHGLVDEYQFVVSPLILGAGQSMIRESTQRALSLVEAKTFPSGTLLLRYHPAK